MLGLDFAWILCLIWCFYQTHIFAYTVEEILSDRVALQSEFHELVKYRGPILKHAWAHNKGNHEGHDSSDLKICDRLFEKALEAANVTWPPPRHPAEQMKEFYTMGDRAFYYDWYLQEKQNGGDGYDWNTKVMESYRARSNVCGGYNTDICAHVIEKHTSLIEGKSAVVVGSQSPWLEAALYNAKVRQVTTIEYMRIKSDYSNFTYFHPSDVAKNYLEKKWKEVDLIFSYSSIEHDGLGRYGDPLNPFADLESVGRMRCLLKTDGYLFLGFPVAHDAVAWNAHRIYGKYRLFLMLLGWKVVDIYPDNYDVKAPKNRNKDPEQQPFLILQKVSSNI